MKRRKVTVAVLSVVLAAAALTGCGSAQQTNGPKDPGIAGADRKHQQDYRRVEHRNCTTAGTYGQITGGISGDS